MAVLSSRYAEPPAMPTSALATFATVLSTFWVHFTAPTFVRFVILAVGWILTSDPRGGGCVTEALLAARVSGQMHWQAFHRFFSRAVWKPDALGRTLFELLAPMLVGVLELALDDTVCQKRGPYVFGASMHVDAVTSTTKRKNFVRGHCWVNLVVVVKVPWSKRPWAIPLLSRLYRGKKEAGCAYRKKSELAREMLDLFLTWVAPDRRLFLLLDSGYMSGTMLGGLALERITVIGSLKTNVALTAGPIHAPKSRGRKRKKGLRLPTPAQLHHDHRRAWTKVTIDACGIEREKETLSLKVQWYGVLRERICHVVLVREDADKLRVVLCTDESPSVQELLAIGAKRWAIEVWFRDAKQFFGFADSPAWSENAVLRTAPWVALLSGIVVVWFHRLYSRRLHVPMPERPWYLHKQDLSFADVLRAAHETLGDVQVASWARAIVQRRPHVFTGAVEAKTAVTQSPIETRNISEAA